MESNGLSSSPTTAEELRREVERLQNELQRESTKLATWKEKAKAGVEQLRSQIVDLSAALEEAQRERDRLSEQLATSPKAPSEALHVRSKDSSPQEQDSTGALAALATSLGRLSAHTEDALSSFLADETAKVHLFTACLPRVSVGAVSSSSPTPPTAPPLAGGAEAAEELEAYKRRVATTLKLQTRNCEILQRQVEELKATVATANDALRDRDRVLAGRDETVALLEQRLDESQRLVREVEAQRDLMLRGPNMDDVNAISERMEQEVAHVRAEYAAREDAIFVQHQDELDRLRASVEEEAMRLRNECEDRIQQAVQVALARQAEELARETARSHSRRDDAAYGELLREYEKLQSRLRTLESDNASLRREATCRSGAFANERGHASMGGSVNDHSDGSAPRHVSSPVLKEPASLEEAKRLLTEQQADLGALSEQLWLAKKGLIDSQRQLVSTAALPAGALDPQQAAYLRSVLVRLLCATREDAVIVNLLPVLSTLLSFSGDDLKQIYKTNPSWLSKK